MSEIKKDLTRFGPKSESGSGIGRPCPACDEIFKAGDFTTLVMLGPGGDAKAREKAAAGLPYNAIALEVHWSCATGKESMEAGLTFKAEF
jgi:hypothetical protein